MILLDNVSKYYKGDKYPALDEVNLHIQPKEFVFLVGESGAGKSTLIKMLTREEKPTYGNIMVGGIDYRYMKKRHIPHLRRRLGVVFQDYKLLPNRTVYENVAFALEIVGVSNSEIKRTVPKVLELVGLSEKATRRSFWRGTQIPRSAFWWPKAAYGNRASDGSPAKDSCRR